MRSRKSNAATASHATSRARRADSDRHERAIRVTRWALTPEIAAELAEVAAAAGCELIHAEWKGGVLRLVLDRPASPAAAPATAAGPPAAGVETGTPEASTAGTDAAAPPPTTAGVSLGDCEHVARQASALLDVLDFGNGRYLLEVSSPGLDRQLYRPSDYQRFLGRLARITYEAAAPAETGSARRRTVVARLAELHPPPSGGPAPAAAIPGDHGPLGTVTLVDDRTGERLTLKLEDIRLARLEAEL